MFRDMLNRAVKSLILLCFFSYQLHAQIGGQYTYSFLDIPSTSRITAMGGNMISMRDDDPGAASDAPSLMHSGMDGSLLLSYNSYFAGINNLFSSYTFENKLGLFNGGIKYVNYGTFREADAGNNELGSFTASEVAFIAGYARPLDSNFTVGANLKFIYSNLYLMSSTGIALDLSATYELKKHLFLATMLVKNLGAQIKPYVPGERDPLPLDVQFGVSKSFNRMPFRFSLIVHQLAKGNLTYPPLEDNVTSNFGGDEQSDNSQSAGQNIIRHFIIGTEFIPFKGMNFQLAYNFQRRREMAFSERPGTVGLSWGFGIRISKFHFNYARSAYHLAGSPNHITILTKFSDWTGKKS